MLEVDCADLGIVCRSTVKAPTKEELVTRVAQHAAKKHGVPELNDTLVAYALTKVSGTEESRESAR